MPVNRLTQKSLAAAPLFEDRNRECSQTKGHSLMVLSVYAAGVTVDAVDVSEAVEAADCCPALV